jgi:hypothetical protein
MKNNELARLALIVIAAVVFILLINSYNTDNGSNVVNNMGNNMVNNRVNNVETFYADGEDVEDAPTQNVVGANEVDSEDEEEEVNASEGEGDENVTFRNVPENQPEPQQNNAESGRLPTECYPKDTLTPQDLLPQDSNSTWAQTVPAGQGSLGDQNFLNAGFHVGINTVGQSLRNANLQLRSEPANPQMKVSPWLQSTIDPDVNRKALEIGA